MVGISTHVMLVRASRLRSGLASRYSSFASVSRPRARVDPHVANIAHEPFHRRPPLHVPVLELPPLRLPPDDADEEPIATTVAGTPPSLSGGGAAGGGGGTQNRHCVVEVVSHLAHTRGPAAASSASRWAGVSITNRPPLFRGRTARRSMAGGGGCVWGEEGGAARGSGRGSILTVVDRGCCPTSRCRVGRGDWGEGERKKPGAKKWEEVEEIGEPGGTRGKGKGGSGIDDGRAPARDRQAVPAEAMRGCSVGGQPLDVLSKSVPSCQPTATSLGPGGM